MTDPARLLVVDDEPLNLEILAEYLSDPRYSVVTAENGMQAWEALEAASAEFDLIVLDRMMPVMDGMTFLKKLKADARYAQIPVVMQTAAASKEQIGEGLQSGAYYYLIKPYEQEVLLSIIEAALTEQYRQRELRGQLKAQEVVLKLLNQGNFSFRTLPEARQLAAFLASLCPKPEAVVVGLAELMINAVEHGNLAISYQEKTKLNETGSWAAEIERRLESEQYGKRLAHVLFERTAEVLRFTIEDEGAGFIPDNYMEMQAERAFDNHGRGIAIAKMLSFGSIQYLGKGNIVIAEVTL